MEALDGYPKDQHRQLLEGNLAGWQNELAGHRLTIEVNEGLPEDLQNAGTRNAIQQSQDAIMRLESSIATVRRLLEGLDG